MNRLQKKCFIAATGLHLLLILILLVGPAFLSSRNKLDDMPVLDMVPAILVDAAVMGGGNPNARPPPVLPAPEPKRETQPPPAPLERAKPVEPVRDENAKVMTPVKPDSLALPDKRDPKKPQVSTDLVMRKPGSRSTAKPLQNSREKEMADSRRAADKVGQTVRSLQKDLTSSTTIETNYGSGGGGEAYANYDQMVKSIYTQAWIAPDDTASDEAVTKVSVLIASDGTVLSARILQPSGDQQVDESVQRTLDRVTVIAPFPAGAKEKQRPYTINFNLKAKRLLE